MAADFTIDDINKQQDDLQAAVAKEHADVQAYIDNLKAQIAAGTAVTPAQLDALGAKILATTAMVNEFDVTNSLPPAVVPPVASA